MDDNTYDNFKSILRSLSIYARRDPVQQYGTTQFNTWKNNNGNKLTEIKKTHGQFSEKDIPEVTEEYFQYAKDNGKVLDQYDRIFLALADNLDIFVERHSFQDLRDELLLGTNPLNNTLNTTSNASGSQAVNNITTQTQTLRIGSRITIDKLSGKEEDLDEWFELFERLAAADGWTDSICGQRLPSYLEDTALMVWKNMTRDHTNYSKIKDIILKELQVERNYLMEFCVRKQKEAESVVDFAQHLQWLAKKCSIEANSRDSQILKNFWKGLTVSVKRLIISQNPATLDEAVEIAKRAEKLLREQREEKQINMTASGARPSRSHSPDSRTSQNSSRSPIRNSLKKEITYRRDQTPKPDARRPLKCYKCSAEGHLARECGLQKAKVENRVCFKCNTKGHIARNCAKN
jgi:hypothetical protein